MPKAIHPYNLYRSRDVADRKGCIGGSSWNDMYGIEPWGCRRRFFLAYDGMKDDPDFKPGPWLQRGKDLEPVILKMYADKYSCQVLPFDEAAFGGRCFEGDVPDWSWPHPDGLVHHHPKYTGIGIVDAKCLFPKTVTEILTKGVPEGYQMQLIHYMAAEPCEWSVLAILDFMNWEIHEVYFPFDQGKWDAMKGSAESNLERSMFVAPLPRILINQPNGSPHKTCQTCRFFHQCRERS